MYFIRGSRHFRYLSLVTYQSTQTKIRRMYIWGVTKKVWLYFASNQFLAIAHMPFCLVMFLFTSVESFQKNTSNIELFSPSTPTIWNGRLSQPCRATQAFYCDDITVVLCSLRGTLPVKSVAGKKEPCPSCEGQSCFTQWNDISSGTIKDPMGKCVFFLIPANRNHLSITINHDSKVLPNGSSPAGMCKNPGGRTSTTRTYHSLGAMLPSNWSIVDPM